MGIIVIGMSAQNIHIDIVGMSCATCSQSVQDALSALAGVEEVSVNVATDEAAVTYDPAVTSLENYIKPSHLLVTTRLMNVPQSVSRIFPVHPAHRPSRVHLNLLLVSSPQMSTRRLMKHTFDIILP
ncbi:MAG: cation transport ATPase [Haloquadratum walsbyi J07HQW1]|uniref:Cation transport ATPase n=1 Tax=Haloquadratum walsbyi J07HQW1 TaxID=1238424 RepID=U1N1U2_9EURY|nr:MAG: cation transport ATPase [Haloquadratum walsbyi J07HQW1]